MIARRIRCICRAGREGKAVKNPGMFRCITPGINLALGADSLPLAILPIMTAAPITSAGRFSPFGPLGSRMRQGTS
jgi:hypothetical protein